MPLLLQFNTKQQFKKSFHIATGLLLSYKFNSHLKLVYNDDGDREKSKRRDEFNTEPFRYDATFRIGYEHYTLYASYAINGLFKDGRGPTLHPFQVGINLFGW
ncbi:MAG: outer membrane beta-barrel protein [Bacteroidetes bacterium]|nr:outer membrane beta-barrel protein [Bacteroidota bacterium]